MTQLVTLEASSRDEPYLGYLRDKADLEYITHVLGRVQTRLPALRLELSEEEIKHGIRKARERRSALRKTVLKFERSVKKSQEPSISQNKMRALEFFRHLFQTQQAQAGRLVVLAESGNCQLVQGVVTHPSQHLLFEDASGLTNEGSTSQFIVTEEYATDLRLHGSMDADDNWGWDRAQHCLALAVHQYDIPAPTCDSLVTWWVRHMTHLWPKTLTASSATIDSAPVIFVSPSGSAPTVSDLLAAVNWERGPDAHLSDGDLEVDYGVQPVYEYTGSYMVAAGVTSKIFCGGFLRLWGVDGWVTAETEAYVAPPAPTSNIPYSDAGVSYLSWPESMFPNCYLSTAVCAVLAKRDDCYELGLLRQYRDSYVRALPNGDALVARYYAHAPQLMAYLVTMPDAHTFLNALLDRFISPCIKLIERGENAAALDRYREMLLHIEGIVRRHCRVGRGRLRDPIGG